MLTALVELIFEFVIEFLFEAMGEVAAEFGVSSWEKARGNKTFNSIILVVGYAAFGAILGLTSYFVLPQHLNFSRELRIASLVISPLGTGFILCFVSYFISRKDRNEPFFSLAKFVQGIVFGLSYSLTRAALA